MNIYPVTRLQTDGLKAYGYSGLTHRSYYVKEMPNDKVYTKTVKITDAAIVLDSTNMDNVIAGVQMICEENDRLSRLLNEAMKRIERLEYNTWAIRRIENN